MNVLDGCVAKLLRAEHIIAELIKEHDAFLRTANQFAAPISAKRGEKFGQHKTIEDDAEHPPPSLAVIVGDILHEYRSVLDHVMWALTPDSSRSKETNFPIMVSRNEVRFSKRVAALSPTAQRMVEAAQPFNSPSPEEHPLWLLQCLNIIDKHKVLLVSKSKGFRPFVTVSLQLDYPKLIGPGVAGASATGSVTSQFAGKSSGDKAELSVTGSADGDSHQQPKVVAGVSYSLVFGRDCGPAAGKQIPAVIEPIKAYMNGPLVFGNEDLRNLLAARVLE